MDPAHAQVDPGSAQVDPGGAQSSARVAQVDSGEITGPHALAGPLHHKTKLGVTSWDVFSVHE